MQQRLLLILSILGFSCQPSEQNTSQVFHEEGVLHRPAPFVHEACEASAAAAAQTGDLGTNLSLYLSDMGREIMRRSNQSFESEGKTAPFRDALAPENFCFYARTSETDMLNAFANSAQREISFIPYTFQALPSEAALAAVMCHELAHVSMAHNGSALRADIEAKLLSKNPRYQEDLIAANTACNKVGRVSELEPQLVDKLYGENSATAQAFKKINLDLLGYVEAHFFEFILGIFRPNPGADLFTCRNRAEAYRIMAAAPPAAPEAIAALLPAESFIWQAWQEEKQMIEASRLETSEGMSPAAALDFMYALGEELDQLHGSGRYAFLNWQEQEADEVGYEICLRAGVDMSQYAKLHAHILETESPGALAQCMDDIEAGRLIDRKLGTHPSPCWRIYDIVKLESAKHVAYYDALMERIPRTPLFGEDRLPALLDMFEAQTASRAE